MGVLQGAIIGSSVLSRKSFRPVKRDPFQHTGGTNPLLFYKFMLYHLIFTCSIYGQDIAERDFESLQNTQTSSWPAKNWITAFRGGGVAAWVRTQMQTQTRTPILSACPVDAPELNMSTWLGNRKERVEITILEKATRFLLSRPINVLLLTLQDRSMKAQRQSSAKLMLLCVIFSWKEKTRGWHKERFMHWNAITVKGLVLEGIVEVISPQNDKTEATH